MLLPIFHLCHLILAASISVIFYHPPFRSLVHPSPSLSPSLSRYPKRHVLQFFTVDPGVRSKTYTHKQHLLFMPYSLEICSQASATMAGPHVGSPQSLSEISSAAILNVTTLTGCNGIEHLMNKMLYLF